MAKTMKDATITVYNKMGLEIKEMRESSTMYSPKEGFDEVSSETRTRFQWKLRGIASKLGSEVIGSDAFDPHDQEIYDVTIASHGFDMDVTFSGFKSREEAIRNAMAVAARNELEVDGYKAKDSE